MRIERLCDLLTVSCPQTLQLLQNQVDRIVIGSHNIRYDVYICVFTCIYCFVVHTPHIIIHTTTTGKSSMVAIIMMAR